MADGGCDWSIPEQSTDQPTVTGNQRMEVGRVSVTLVITALIVLTGHQNGFVSATTSGTESSLSTATTMESSTTGKQTSEQTTTTTTMTTASNSSTKASPPETDGLGDDAVFNTVMIVMIVVLGFIVIFSVSCGLCVIYGIDVGCPIPCCGGSGKEKIPTGSANGMKLKRSSRPDRISSQRLQDVEEFQEVECKGFKGHDNAAMTQTYDF